MRPRRAQSGQTGTEYMLVVSVVVIAVVAAAYVFVPRFQNGTIALGTKVKTILGTGEVGGIGVTTSIAGPNVNSSSAHAIDDPTLGPTIGSPSFGETGIANGGASNLTLHDDGGLLGAPVAPTQ